VRLRKATKTRNTIVTKDLAEHVIKHKAAKTDHYLRHNINAKQLLKRWDNHSIPSKEVLRQGGNRFNWKNPGSSQRDGIH
jgi:hypothetical protein